jgi:magnesium-transporting ATPase (P-type)
MPSNPQRPSAERIEFLQRRRTRLAFVQGAFFLIWQANFFNMNEDSGRLVDHVKLSAYIFWCVILLAFIGTGGGWIQPRAVRVILNDESTIAHRRQAMAWGYWAAMGAALGCYVVSLFEPMSAREAIHTVLSLGIVTAILNFAFLERRAQREGGPDA